LKIKGFNRGDRPKAGLRTKLRDMSIHPPSFYETYIFSTE